MRQEYSFQWLTFGKQMMCFFRNPYTISRFAKEIKTETTIGLWVLSLLVFTLFIGFSFKNSLILSILSEWFGLTVTEPLHFTKFLYDLICYFGFVVLFWMLFMIHVIAIPKLIGMNVKAMEVVRYYAYVSFMLSLALWIGYGLFIYLGITGLVSGLLLTMYLFFRFLFRHLEEMRMNEKQSFYVPIWMLGSLLFTFYELIDFLH